MIDLQQPMTKQSATMVVLSILGVLAALSIGFYVVRGFFHSNSVSPTGEPPIIGEIKTIVGSQMLITGPKGDQAVRLASGTHYENGGYSSLHEGVLVMVVGSSKNGIQNADKVIINPGHSE